MSNSFNLERQLKEISSKLDELLLRGCCRDSEEDLASVDSDDFSVGDIVYRTESPGDYKLLKVLEGGQLVNLEDVDVRQNRVTREEIDQEAHYFWYVRPGTYPLYTNDSNLLDIRRK